MRHSPAEVGPLGDVALGGAPTAEARRAAGPLWARLGAVASLEVKGRGPDTVGTTQERWDCGVTWHTGGPLQEAVGASAAPRS